MGPWQRPRTRPWDRRGPCHQKHSHDDCQTHHVPKGSQPNRVPPGGGGACHRSTGGPAGRRRPGRPRHLPLLGGCLTGLTPPGAAPWDQDTKAENPTPDPLADQVRDASASRQRMEVPGPSASCGLGLRGQGRPSERTALQAAGPAPPPAESEVACGSDARGRPRLAGSAARLAQSSGTPTGESVRLEMTAQGV